MGLQKNDKPDDWIKIRNQWLWDDFLTYTSPSVWTTGTSGTGTTVALNAASAASQVLIGNAGSTVGAEAWVATTSKFWAWSANHPLHLCAKISVAEAATNNCSLFVGFSDSFATGLVSSANPNAFKASSTSCGFFLPAGSTNWSVVLAVAGAPTVVATIENAVSAVDQYLEVQTDIVGNGIEATFRVGLYETIGGADSIAPVGTQQAREGASGYNKPIKLRLPYAGAAAMAGGVYLRQITAAAETVKVDLLGLLNLR